MDFIISNKQYDKYQSSIRVAEYFINYTLNHKVKSREFVLENEKCMIIGDANLSFSKRIKNSNLKLSLIKGI